MRELQRCVSVGDTDVKQHHAARPRVLVVTEALPRPDESAGSSRLLAVVTHLALMGRHVDLWVEHDECEGQTPLSPARVERDRRRLEALGVRVLPATWRAFRQAVTRQRYSAVVFEFYHVAARYMPAMRRLQPHATLVVDSVDVHFARLSAGAAIGAVHPQWARDVHDAETRTYRAADVVIAASAADVRVLEREPGMPPLVCVPVSVVPRARERRQRDTQAVFVGHFRHDPNLDGLTWFVRDVWPGVRVRHPNATLTVIGSYPTPAVYALGRQPGVHVVGHVADLSPYMDAAAAAIAPLRFGAGMKGKVTDALAAGLPLVTTSVGAQGLELVDGQHAWIADEASEFAAALSSTFEDQVAAAAMGARGQAHVSRLCGPDVVAAGVRAALDVAHRHRRATAAGLLRGHLQLAGLGLAHWRLSRRRRLARGLSTQRNDTMAGETPVLP